MILEYRIPNGTMTINADVFFLEAGTGQIRKMLKGYRESGAGDEEWRNLIGWMKREAERIQDRISVCRSDYCMGLTQLSEQEQFYRQMKNPCYAAYTRDKEKLKAAKEDISKLKQELQKQNQGIRELGRQEKKYLRCIEIVKVMIEED